MTVLFMEPGTAATQDLSLFSGTSLSGTGAVTSDAQAVKGSVRSLKSAIGATTGFTNATANDTITPNDAGRRGSFYFRMGQNWGGSEIPIFAILSGSNFVFLVNGSDGSGALNVQCQGGSFTFSTQRNTVISANTDYRISWAYTITDSTHYTFQLYLDGVLEMELATNPGQTISTGANTIRYGFQSFRQNGIGGNVCYFAHIITDDGTTGDIWNGVAPASGQPQIGVTAKRPLSNGSANGFTTQIGAGGSGYGTGHAPQVNERPLSETNGWSLNTASAVTEEYSVEGISVGDVDISGNIVLIDYMGWVRAKTTGGTRTCSIVVGGSSSNISVTTTAANYTKVAGSTTYPSGNTDIGIISAAVSDTYSLYECGLIVAYQPITITREQEGYRFRADDGSESTASWLASQDTNITRPTLSPARLRILTNVTNNPPSEALKLQYRKVGDPNWVDLT